ncbi:dihydrofolate reductase [Sediminibacterium roseum]|uniref:Dihydrofolate reductase n=1 Tax=Sediminibacterium roseum TaxID=1978412 RepID=A0ABW9ZZI9_9BACT|nr:dihydrofolate reductase family protein [Sediminibacterium roseum]NCI51960.1 dihydrofolate reductase [Sediminibacterium roseum]
MRRLTVFNFTTVNGFLNDENGNIGWHKQMDPGEDEKEYTSNAARSQHVLVFGRVTYQMMAWYWPSPEAARQNPQMAQSMNESEKIVFSRTLEKADWNNTTLVSGDLIEEIKKLKQQPGNDLTILGSGSLVTQLSDAGLIDQYEIMIDPIAIGSGTPMFNGLKEPLELKLVNSKVFKSGVVVLSYEKNGNG